MRDEKKLKDIMLSLLVLTAALSMTWLGLRSTDNAAVSTIAMASEPTADPLSSLPDDATVIVVDAGHGGFDGGAVGGRTGIAEAELNLKVAKLLADELLKQGYYVIMTREDDNALADTKNADMQQRKKLMQLDCADLVVSIHMNKFKDVTVSGPMVFYMQNSAKGKALAEHVINAICDQSGRTRRYANPEDLFVLREPYAPSILVECGFLSNPDDEAKLCDEAYQSLLAKAICAGIVNYYADEELTSGG